MKTLLQRVVAVFTKAFETKSSRPTRSRLGVESLEDRAVPATLTVNTTLDVLGHDSGMLSLRQTILDANTTPGADTIVVPGGTYTLTQGLTGDLAIKDSVTISGAGAGSAGVKHEAKSLVLDGSSPVTLEYAYPVKNVYLKQGRWPYTHNGCPESNKPAIKGESGAYFRDPTQMSENITAYVSNTWEGVQCPNCKQVLFPAMLNRVRTLPGERQPAWRLAASWTQE